jgi:hypothetical protein
MKNADTIKAYLETIASAHGDRLTPNDVLEDARRPESPLHEYFEWDESKAAQAHRLDQARTLIRSVKIIVTTERRVVTAPYYVRDPDADGDDQGYVSVPKLMTNADIAREALVAEFARASALLQRARDLAAVLGLEGDVDAIIGTIETVRQRAIESGVTAEVN